ncbi:hypothetical protein [Terrabacter sp. BE26]|uniref:hypothetical protein n=1 Tax=Terrabacter sp. BE26 TaxID=2898152 RepID=UPI0035BE3975
MRSWGGLRPGVDVKAGIDGSGHGCAFIAPTVRVSKVTGLVEPYRWLRPPSGLLPVDDGSGVQLARLINNRRSATRDEGGTQATAVEGTAAVPSALAALPEQDRPCEAILAQVDVIAKALANDGRHDAITGPLLRLVGLAKGGHRGLRQACALVEPDFICRVADDRAGGRIEARSEFGRALVGALSRVLAEGQEFPLDIACPCFLAEMCESAADSTFSVVGLQG